jgi:hypothetical protein
MYVIQHYKYDLTNRVHATIYAAMCAKFRAEFRPLQFSNDRPKKLGYRALADFTYFRMEESTFEAIYDWCEYASEENIRAGYYVILPPEAIMCAMPVGGATRPAWLPASPPKGDAPSKLFQAVLYHHIHGGSQAAACARFKCSQSNFKVTRDRLLARGKLI